jgi:putative ABC transport system ATP-binding protein
MTLGNQLIYDDGWKLPDLRTLRRDSIGFVFQAPYLIPFLDVTDNVALLPMLAGQRNAVARARAVELLQSLDVAHRAKAQPSELSGGEQQRVSIARALANRPAGDPGRRTHRAAGQRTRAGRDAHPQPDGAQYHTAIIVVTHDEKIIPTFKRIYHIRDGRTVEEAGEGRVL